LKSTHYSILQMYFSRLPVTMIDVKTGADYHHIFPTENMIIVFILGNERCFR